MCGICGVLNYATGAPVVPDLLATMTNTMVHRGPDDVGLHVAGPVGFGMRRLSIIDLATGHQPMSNDDRTVWITFNGEIYNFTALRTELEAAGHRFRTRSDTEVILRAYEQWGDDCVQRLNGIFGLAIWDEARRRLLLARDHFGVKPLYFRDDGHRLLWGSELKAILADPSVTRAVDLDALDLFLTFRFVPSPWTLFKGIRKLQPGHRLVHEHGRTRVERYWRPQAGSLGHLSSASEGECERLLQERLEAAVARQMMSDVPVGALLSGGVDSTAVVALMRQHTEKPVRTFTVGFRNSSVSETAEARDTAARFGTIHEDVVLDSVDYQNWIARSVWHMEEPNSTTSALALFFVCQLAGKSVKVVLTGQGADEPAAGYHRYYAERYGGLYRRTPGLLRERVLRTAIEALPRAERLKRAVRTMGIEGVTERFVQAYAVFPAPLKAALWRSDRRPSEPGDHEGLAQQIVAYWRRGTEDQHPLAQMAFVDARLSLADDLLMYADKMAMASSVELRVPFLDLEYMAVAEAVPVEFRIRGLTRKYAHSRALRKWVPDDVIRRPKKGFETPIDAWLRGEFAGYVRRTLLGQDSACREYFEAAAIDRLLAEHQAGRQDHQRQLYSLLVFELWHQQFITADPVLAGSTPRGGDVVPVR